MRYFIITIKSREMSFVTSLFSYLKLLLNKKLYTAQNLSRAIFYLINFFIKYFKLM